MQALVDCEEKWSFRYPMIVESWNRHWQELIPFLQFPQFIRRAIYTTNMIEASNRQIRKVIKTKGSFSSDEAVLKLSIWHCKLQRKSGQCRSGIGP